MEAWPAGMVPAALFAEAEGAVLVYRGRDARAEVVMDLRKGAPHVQTRFVAGFEAAAVSRLERSLRYYLKTNERDALPWLKRALRLGQEVVDPRAQAILGRLYRCDVGGARKSAQQLLDHAEVGALANRILGACAVLDNDYENAVHHLSTTLESDSSDSEALLWRAEAYLRTGQQALAHQDVMGVTYSDSPLWQLLRARIEAQSHGDDAVFGPTAFIYQALLRDVLGDEVSRRFSDRSQVLALLDEALSRFGGNRSERLTYLSDGVLVAANLRTVRTQAVDQQHQLLVEPPQTVIRGFETLAARYPEAPFGETYRAEVELWMGDYETALERFEESWRVTQTRWAYVGSGAALFLLGRDDEALARWQEGFESHSRLAAEASYAYRGELYRKRGEYDLARPDLELAVRERPSRLGAWINLALLELATENHRAATVAIQQVVQQSPALVWHACAHVGLAPSTKVPTRDAPRLLEGALDLMQGNRSSVLHTFVVDGELRVIPAQMYAALERWGTQAGELARELSAVASMLKPAATGPPK